MIELVIQLLFIFYIDTADRGPVIMTAISLTGASIIGSFIVIYSKQTSRLNRDNQIAVENFICANGKLLNNDTVDDSKDTFFAINYSLYKFYFPNLIFN